MKHPATPVTKSSRFSNFEPWMVRVVWTALFPAILLGILLVWTSDFGIKTKWTLSLALVVAMGWCLLYLHDRIVVRLRNISSLLAALREGESRHRLPPEPNGGVVSELIEQANQLSGVVSDQRKGVAETQALIEKVTGELDAALFTFDSKGKCRWANRRGLALLGRSLEEVLERHAGSLGLGNCLVGPVPRVDAFGFKEERRRWEVRRTDFRDQGRVQTLVMLSDLTESLRREELDAWRRLVRVLRHEISNSLAPIRSIAETLSWQLTQTSRDSHWEADLKEGLTLITRRASALDRMIKSYAGVVDLPNPRRGSVEVGEWVARVACLFPGAEGGPEPVVEPGETVFLDADGDQLDQLLLNLVKNGVEACHETGGGVRIGWVVSSQEGALILTVEDEGTGFSGDPGNLFVPFFTTKETGSGIGLLVARKIAEAHSGSLTLVNREGRTGCRAQVRLPLERNLHGDSAP